MTRDRVADALFVGFVALVLFFTGRAGINDVKTDLSEVRLELACQGRLQSIEDDYELTQVYVNILTREIRKAGIEIPPPPEESTE